MTKIRYFLPIIAFFFSCNNAIEKKPKNFLDRETMTNIFYDLAILESTQGYLPRILSENQISPKKFIYQKYKIDSLDFVQNNRYYASDVELYKRIYDDVHKKLTTDKENLQLELDKENKSKKEKLKLKQ
jgi:Domain of unknown function (DUF4296)